MRYLIGVIFICLLVISCMQEKDCDQPILFTEEVSEINSNGAVFAASQIDICDCEVLESGFVWDINPNPILETAEKYFIQEPYTKKSFRKEITTTFMKDQIYYVRSFIKNSKYLIYGNEVAFSSKGSSAPTITDFKPKVGNLGDTITITGSNFSYTVKKNVVIIGGQYCNTISANQDTIRAIISNELNVASAQIEVSILGHTAKNIEPFQLYVPLITDFRDKNGSYNSEVTIIGENFLSNPSTLEVRFDNVQAEIIDKKDNQLIVGVPDALNVSESRISVVMNNIEAYSNDNFRLTPVSLLSFYPKKAITGGALTLRGNYFSPISQNNIVTIGGILVNVNKSTLNEIEVTLPLQDKTIYPSRNLSIHVEVAGQAQSYVDNLVINDNWFRLKDAPQSLASSGYSYHYVSCFASENKSYIGLNNSKVLFEYDPQKDEWKSLRDFPGEKRFNGAGFVIGDNVYFGTGSSPSPYHVYYKDWWKYNVNNDSWTQLNNFYGNGRSGAFAFKRDNLGYVGTGSGKNTLEFFTDVWKYNESEDSWSRIADFPKKMTDGIALSTDEYTYAGMGREYATDITFMYRYLPNSNIWESIPDFPHGRDDNQPIGFVIQNQVYISLGYWYPFYRYNASYQIWSKMNRAEFMDFRNSITFSISGKAYVGLGMNNQMWEYDPSR